MSSRFRAKASVLAAALLGTLLLGTAGCERRGTLAPALTTEACDLWTDPSQVVHLHAATDPVAISCMGLIHGRERAFQMDILRRAFQGRRAEVLGRELIRSDFLMRLIGIEERARKLFDGMNEADRGRFRVYAEGVNRGFELALAKGVYEFKAFGIRPDPWRPEDSVGMILLQSFDQTRKTFEQEIKESGWLADAAKRGDREAARKTESWFIDDGLPWDTSVLKPSELGSNLKPTPEAATGAVTAARPGAPGERLGGLEENRVTRAGIEEQGSNNWVISPSRSRTGNAWMANDPHLSLKHPPFWYWLHVQGEGLDAIGATVPGVPAIMSGANRDVAWGLTNSYLDVAELNAVPTGDLRGTSTHLPVIWFRLGPIRLPFFFKRFQRTARGWPVLPLPAPEGRALVLHWTGFDLEPGDFGGIFEVMRARSAAEADEGLGRIGVPSWNFVFADTQGKIGYRAVGRVPKRGAAEPFGLHLRSLDEAEADAGFGAGSRAKAENERILTREEMPHASNPARGFVVTANNRQWPAGSRYHGGRAYAESFRAFRIEELLASNRQHDLESSRRIQCDLQAVDARFFVPLLLRLEGEGRPDAERVALAKIRAWDFETGLDCAPCAIYRRWMDHLLEEGDLNEAALYRELKAAETKDPTSGTATRVRAALAQALADLGITAGKTFPKWSELHLARFEHVAGGGYFPNLPLPTPGDRNSVNPGSLSWNGRFFDHHAGSSQRLVVELTRPPTVHAILAGTNADEERPDLASPKGAWMKWRSCELERKIFPLAWPEGWRGLRGVERVTLGQEEVQKEVQKEEAKKED